MFKELGAFINDVARATGRMIGELLSDKEEEDDDYDGTLMGCPAPDFDKPRIRVKNFTDKPNGPIVK